MHQFHSGRITLRVHGDMDNRIAHLDESHILRVLHCLFHRPRPNDWMDASINHQLPSQFGTITKAQNGYLRSVRAHECGERPIGHGRHQNGRGVLGIGGLWDYLCTGTVRLVSTGNLKISKCESFTTWLRIGIKDAKKELIGGDRRDPYMCDIIQYQSSMVDMSLNTV